MHVGTWGWYMLPRAPLVIRDVADLVVGIHRAVCQLRCYVHSTESSHLVDVGKRVLSEVTKMGESK